MIHQVFFCFCELHCSTSLEGVLQM
ncbi:DUF3927 domain-containing protein [Gelidibacter salicanalis]|uniref:DUF3927 domain-containing protein n=1 Tax=Gelidibacter salicanalis TaxID=291193 RepID=A0A5C7ALE4_9FLAO|nr:DUF3927 domain-containing protein [Gelidibacter salicanalis]